MTANPKFDLSKLFELIVAPQSELEQQKQIHFSCRHQLPDAISGLIAHYMDKFLSMEMPTDQDTSSGRQRYRLMTVDEAVERTFAVVERVYVELLRREWR